MSRLEKSIEVRCCKLARDHGAIAVKLNVESRRGWPDRMILGPKGRMFFVEFKRPGEKPRKLQEFIHKGLYAMGYDVYIVDNENQFRSILDAELPTK